MTESVARRDPVEQLAEEFLARLRRGERPPLSEYTAAHPDLAAEIRDLFPALVLMEEAKPAGPDPTDPPAPGPDRPPGRLGDFHILREVARGGMGVVYEAEQLSLGRHVALKVLPAQAGGDPLRLLRFRREARSAARLHHTNIVPVFEVGECDGVHFYAMQFIQGQGLDEVLQELRRLRAGEKPTDGPADLTVSLVDGLKTGQFPAVPLVPVPRPQTPVPRSETSVILTGSVSHYFRSVAQLGVQAADALAYAHGQRVLHRDVKPSNLLLDLAGTLWLTDFGLAKDGGDDLTRAGDVVGTLRYMAPERFRGVSDPQADVYSLGVTLYEMLTLRPAFPEADRVRLIHQISTDDPPRPRAIDPTLPRDLETIVLKAIEKEPARRYPTAADLAEDLRRFLADRPVKARRASWREQAWRWCRRNPTVAASLATAVAFLVLLVVGLSVGGILVWRAKGEAEAALAEEKQSAYVQRIALAERELATNNLARAEELLALCPPELRRWEWHYLNRSRGRPPVVIRHGHAVAGRSAVSPDGRRVATIGMNGSVTVWDLTTRAPAWPPTPTQSNPAWQVAYSPDGRYLATTDEPAGGAAGDGEIKLWHPDTGALLHRWKCPGHVVNGLAISPDGRRLAITRYRLGALPEEVEVRDPATGALLVSLPPHQEATQGLAFSPDGRLLASASCDETVRVYDSHTGRTLHEFPDDRPGKQPYWCVAFSPDGRRVAAGYGVEWDQVSGGVRVWEVGTGRECASLVGHAAHAVTFGPGGRLVSGGLDATVRIWEPDRGQEILTLRGHTDVVWSAAFTPDGHRLVTSSEDRTVRVWDATPVGDGEHLGDELFTLTGHTNSVRAVAFHPTEPLLASGGSDGVVRLWDARAGFAPHKVFRTTLQAVLAVAYDPEGGRLAVGGQPGDGCGILDAVTGQLRLKLDVTADEWPQRLAFAPDGTLLAGCNGDGKLFVWDTGTGKARRLGGHQRWLLGLAFGPDPRRPLVATASTSGEVRVWDPTTGGEVVPPLGHESAQAVAFSRDGRWLATVGWDKVVRVWDTTTWKPAEQVRDPTGRPNGVAFSPDGRLVAWGGTDSTVKVWRRGSEDVVTLRGHRNWIGDVVFSPDGAHLASASRDTTVKIWKTPSFGNR